MIEFVQPKNMKTLDERKIEKIQELNDICEQYITNGITSSNGHQYRCNRDDQTNMMGQYNELMFDKTISYVDWKTQDAGYIRHTREDWLTVYREAFQHKKYQLFKYDALKKKVIECQSPKEVLAITWDGDISVPTI